MDHGSYYCYSYCYYHVLSFFGLTGSQGLLQAQFLFKQVLLPPVHLICILLGNLARQIFSPTPSLGTSIPYLSPNCPFSSICSANVCCCSVAKLCLTLCDPMDCNTSGSSVLPYLPEFAQTHVDDAIQPSHPLSSPSLPAFNLSQHQGLLQ